jgi:hypothetical protein
MWPDGSFAVIMATAIRDCERETLERVIKSTIDLGYVSGDYVDDFTTAIRALLTEEQKA